MVSLEVPAMLCVACGAQMHLVEVRCDDTMMVRGYGCIYVTSC